MPPALGIPQADLPDRDGATRSHKPTQHRRCISLDAADQSFIKNPKAEAKMKLLIPSVLIALAVLATVVSFANYHTTMDSEPSFQLARKFCPGGKC
jgi:hypothetical protein